MTDLNTYLRRADVEGLLQTKIDATMTKISENIEKLSASTDIDNTKLRAIARDIADDSLRVGALKVALQHLDLCEQFILIDNGALRRRNGRVVNYENPINTVDDAVPVRDFDHDRAMDGLPQAE